MIPIIVLLKFIFVLYIYQTAADNNIIYSRLVHRIIIVIIYFNHKTKGYSYRFLILFSSRLADSADKIEFYGFELLRCTS